ncbi:MAG: prepilin peptidase [Planctomycetes bacterium]|nr:prepilin peptidase [Planctomycetota bacterium]
MHPASVKLPPRTRWQPQIGPTRWYLLAFLLSAASVIPIRICLDSPSIGVCEVLALLVLAAAAGNDLIRGLIPNSLTYSAAVGGMVLAATHSLTADFSEGLASFIGGPGFGHAMASLLAVLLVGSALSLGGGLGGGDVKLLAAVSPLLGAVATLSILFLGSCVLATFYVINRLFNGRPLRSMQRAFASTVLTNGASIAGHQHEFDRRFLPLAPGLFFGALLLPVLARSSYFAEMWP